MGSSAVEVPPDWYRSGFPLETVQMPWADRTELEVERALGMLRPEGGERVLDLACGTGRIGQWLRAQGIVNLDGLDFTPAMLAKAEARGVYDRLLEGDVRATGVPDAHYDLALMVLADEHLDELGSLYREVARVTAPGGSFLLVGYHPHFMLNGIPTHFRREDGQQVAIETYVHLMSDHVKAAHRSGWTLVELEEGLVDQDWLAK
jgi:SAM-dependent methyltransferase